MSSQDKQEVAKVVPIQKCGRKKVKIYGMQFYYSIFLDSHNVVLNIHDIYSICQTDIEYQNDTGYP